jgi:uncharacterized protein YjiS (DUF1127 family)
MTSHSSTTCTQPCPRPRRFGSIRALWALRALARQRRDLARLDPSGLQDIGLSPEAAKTESTRPFWDAPHHWKA